MKEVAKYYISDKFIISGIGLIFAGHILEGQVSLGNFIQFPFDGQMITRKVKGVDGMSHSVHNLGVFDKMNTGIMIECESEDEIQQIRNSSLKNIEAIIFKS